MRMGEQVLPKGLSLHEDPHRPRTSASRPFDAEGLQTRARDLVADGVLQGWVLDLASARKLGVESTGNCHARHLCAAQPRHHQLGADPRRAQPRRPDRADGHGAAGHVADRVHHQPQHRRLFARGSGFWVENGAIAYPVNECTIAGNLRDMLRRIIPANDARAHLSHVVPSLLVEGMTLAGE